MADDLRPELRFVPQQKRQSVAIAQQLNHLVIGSGVFPIPIGSQLLADPKQKKNNTAISQQTNYLLIGIQPAGASIPIGAQLWQSATPRKYQLRAPWMMGRREQGLPQPPFEMPIGMRWFESAPPRKKQVRFYQDPNQQIIGLPIPQEYPAFLTTGGIGERRWPASVDQYPNLLQTTFFVAPGPLPIGKQLLTIAPPRKAQVRIDIMRTNLTLSLPFATPPGLPLALPVDTNQAKRKYAVVDLNYLWPNSQLPNRPDPAPGIESLYVGKALGGGGTGLGHHRRNKGAERYVDIAELEVIVRALTGEKASYKMVYETDEILSRFSESEHPEIEDVDFISLAEDKDAVAQIMAIWKRFNEKRNEMFNHLRKIDFDWEE